MSDNSILTGCTNTTRTTKCSETDKREALSLFAREPLHSFKQLDFHPLQVSVPYTRETYLPVRYYITINTRVSIKSYTCIEPFEVKEVQL